MCELSEIGDLFDAKQRMTSSGHRIWDPFNESEARHIIHGITKELIHLHSIGIAHGDKTREYSDIPKYVSRRIISLLNS